MLADLYAFLVSASTTGLSSDQQAAIAGLRAQVGTRVYPDVLKEGSSLPALTYQLISNGSELCGDGDSGLYHPRVQIDVWTQNDAVARDLIAGYLKTALHGFSGSIGGTFVDVLIWDNEINSFEPERKQSRAMLDFKVLHN